jgi:uncharacterized protein (DUF2252 family)
VKHDVEVARGLAQRAITPRSAHAELGVLHRDAVAILDTQNATRVPELVPLRHERMTASPFAFYRATAAHMAADLAQGAVSGIHVVSCGDAHLSNFGFYASPQRTLVFDLNDFDEAAIAPWEWDVKRLVTSVVIGARDVGHSDDETRAAARAAVAGYRRGLDDLLRLPALDRYYYAMDVERIRASLDEGGRAVLDRAAKRARRQSSDRVASRFSRDDGDGRRFIDDPPVLLRLGDLDRAWIETLVAKYRTTTSPDIALLLSQYELTDVARRVVGVGSVGTRCFILLLTGPRGASLVLQVKEALPSVLHQWGGIQAAAAEHDGERVVRNQRILQAVSDPFLGYLTIDDRHFYVRQFRDMKGSIDITGLTAAEFTTYVAGCGRVLARGHVQSPEAPAILGYVGRSGRAEEAIVDWAFAYADQSLADYRSVLAAVSLETS